MTMKGQGMISALLMVVIGVAVVIAIVNGIVNSATQFDLFTNESHAVGAGGSNRSFVLDNLQVAIVGGSDSVLNDTTDFPLTRVTACDPDPLNRNYTINLVDGNLTLCNASGNGNYLVTYQSQPSSFVTDSQTRTILALVPVLVGIILLLAIFRLIQRR